jgi:RNA polymerase sigma-70 factor (ECF subfamily)
LAALKDDEIIRLFTDRDERAPEEARQKYGTLLEGIARGILRDQRDAEECVNDALMAAWDNIAEVRPSNLKAYLKTLTRNISLDRARANSAEKRQAEREAAPYEELENVAARTNVEADADADELAAAISEFLRGRRDLERRIFIRRYWFGDSIADIAKRFGIGESKVKMTLKRTRDKLSDALNKGEFLK